MGILPEQWRKPAHHSNHFTRSYAPVSSLKRGRTARKAHLQCPNDVGGLNISSVRWANVLEKINTPQTKPTPAFALPLCLLSADNRRFWTEPRPLQSTYGLSP